MKRAIADYLWGRIWFLVYLKKIKRNFLIRKYWHYIKTIENLTPTDSIAYRRFLVHPQPDKITNCAEFDNIEIYKERLATLCVSPPTLSYSDSLWMSLCNRSTFQPLEVCKIYWMAPFVDEFYSAFKNFGPTTSIWSFLRFLE